MSLRILCTIKLQYVIRLEEPKIYTVSLSNCNEFSEFNISLHPNEEGNDFYNPEYKEDVCNYIEVDATLLKYNYERYNQESEGDFITGKIPEQDRNDIFECIKEKINPFLTYLKYRTKMFWIEGLPINPISGVIGIGTEFSFINPNSKVSRHIRNSTVYYDNYMTCIEACSILPVNVDLINDYKDAYLVKDIWTDYLLKANKAMYQSEYENFIIYCAISAESFIKRLTSLDSEIDIVLQKLKEAGKNQMVETYYKVISKYLFGKSLLEINEGLYNNLVLIFKLRNDIMHKGHIDDESLKKVGLLKLDFEVCNIILGRLEKTTNEIVRLLAEKTLGERRQQRLTTDTRKGPEGQ